MHAPNIAPIPQKCSFHFTMTSYQNSRLYQAGLKDAVLCQFPFLRSAFGTLLKQF